ncbi:MAG: SMP-30/gluconolactonase/LRE family protein [Rhodopila sp.]|nr:SMP-30/gluconolactonase/LRE family protein [Rhodopila sp.]
MWQPSERYPDPAVQILDPRFARYRVFNSTVERLATGMRWGEGPVWFGDHRVLLWSDIPNNRIMRWSEVTGEVDVFRSNSNLANGNTRDRQGRLVTCEQQTRRVVRTEHDGSITVLADTHKGFRLNSPNDVVVKSDDSIWFTDPPFGIDNNHDGVIAEQELPMNVYRIDPRSGALTAVLEDIPGPNGLCFSPDERLLYLVQSRAKPNRLITAHRLSGDGTRVDAGEAVIDCDTGTADGIRCDADGNIWCGWGMGSDELDGVMVFASDGTKIGRVALPERCANLCFGGRYANRLFMATGHGLYAVYFHTSGAKGG